MAHPGQLVIGVIAGQHLGDEFRAPPIVHPVLDRRTQRIVDELERLGSAGFFTCPGMGHQGVIVAISITVALMLAVDHRSITPDPLADLCVAQLVVEATHNLHALPGTEPVPTPAGQRHVPRVC